MQLKVVQNTRGSDVQGQECPHCLAKISELKPTDGGNKAPTYQKMAMASTFRRPWQGKKIALHKIRRNVEHGQHVWRQTTQDQPQRLVADCQEFANRSAHFDHGVEHIGAQRPKPVTRLEPLMTKNLQPEERTMTGCWRRTHAAEKILQPMGNVKQATRFRTPATRFRSPTDRYSSAARLHR